MKKYLLKIEALRRILFSKNFIAITNIDGHSLFLICRTEFTPEKDEAVLKDSIECLKSDFKY